MKQLLPLWHRGVNRQTNKGSRLKIWLTTWELAPKNKIILGWGKFFVYEKPEIENHVTLSLYFKNSKNSETLLLIEMNTNQNSHPLTLYSVITVRTHFCIDEPITNKKNNDHDLRNNDNLITPRTEQLLPFQLLYCSLASCFAALIPAALILS